MFNKIISNKIDYRETRALQISIVFATALLIQRILGYTHAGWIGFAVMMIYAGFDKGASLQRTIHRFWGAILGLLLSYLLWIIGQIDFRLILIIIPMIVFMAYFTLGKLYAIPTIFTITLAILGNDYYGNNSNYALVNFFFDYFLSTVIAVILCLLFEYYIFNDSKLAHKFYLDLQQKIILRLENLFNTVVHKPIRQNYYLKRSAKLNAGIQELNNFVNTLKHDLYPDIKLAEEVIFFNSTVQHVYHNIRRLFVASPYTNEFIITEIHNILQELKIINQNERKKYLGE